MSWMMWTALRPRSILGIDLERSAAVVARYRLSLGSWLER